MEATKEITKEERDIRIALAKALWRQEAGDSVPTDGKARQEAFEAVRKEMITKAVKIQKTLERLGYTIAVKIDA